MEQIQIEYSEGKTISLIKYGQKYFEYHRTHFALDFTETSDEELDEITEWCKNHADLSGNYEDEYLFHICYWDKDFIVSKKPPEKMKNILKAAVMYATRVNKDLPQDEKITPCLIIWTR